MPEAAARGIPGADQIVSWFGHWPSFHDSEVLQINLNRKGQSLIRLHAFRMTKQVDETGHFVLDRHAIVTFRLEGVSDLELVDFSGKNVIFGLSLESVEAGLKMTLEPCYGVAGYVVARQISVSLEPGAPEAGT
jgi:hypothetical protein